jgi:hypothetical protein
MQTVGGNLNQTTVIFDPKTFYQSYQKDYHKIKASYLKGIMENLKDLESSFFGSSVDNDDRGIMRLTDRPGLGVLKL